MRPDATSLQAGRFLSYSGARSTSIWRPTVTRNFIRPSQSDHQRHKRNTVTSGRQAYRYGCPQGFPIRKTYLPRCIHQQASKASIFQVVVINHSSASVFAVFHKFFATMFADFGAPTNLGFAFVAMRHMPVQVVEHFLIGLARKPLSHFRDLLTAFLVGHKPFPCFSRARRVASRVIDIR